MASGILPLKTAVACLPMLFRAMVKPKAAASSSTLGLALTVTKMLVTCGRRFKISCMAEPEMGVGLAIVAGMAVGAPYCGAGCASGVGAGVVRGCILVCYFLLKLSVFDFSLAIIKSFYSEILA